MPAQLIYYRSGLPRLTTEEKREFLDSIKTYIEGDGSDQIINTMNFLARLTAKHELGHVLGYGHTDALEYMDQYGAPYNNSDVRNVPMSHRIVVRRYPPFRSPTGEAGIPLMTRYIREYVEYLWRFLGSNRRLRESDIAISPQELYALSLLSSEAAKGCLPSSSSGSKHIKRIGSSAPPYCANFPVASPAGAIPALYKLRYEYIFSKYYLGEVSWEFD
jgi:hypothetical protein